MDCTSILANVQRIVPLSEEHKQVFLSCLEHKKVPKRTLLLKVGEVAKNSYYVQKGVLRLYKTDANNDEHTMYFSVEDWWCGDLHSLLSGMPTDKYVEVLEDAEVLVLSKEAQEGLYEKAPVFERYFRIMLERNIIATQNLSYDRMASTAQYRYEMFLQRYPDLELRIAQKHIASYIGVTPEFLSRMKHDMYKPRK